MPGLTLSFNKLDSKAQRSSLFSFLDAIFSIAIFEQVDLIRTIDDVARGVDAGPEIQYFAKPYEAFCKENLSFLTKLLYATKFATGLDFTLKNFGFKEDTTINKYVHTSEYKMLGVRATPSKLIFNIKFTIASDNYAKDLQSFFNLKKAKNVPMRIVPCLQCRSSAIFVKNMISDTAKPDYKVYSLKG